MNMNIWWTLLHFSALQRLSWQVRLEEIAWEFLLCLFYFHLCLGEMKTWNDVVNYENKLLLEILVKMSPLFAPIKQSSTFLVLCIWRIVFTAHLTWYGLYFPHNTNQEQNISRIRTTCLELGKRVENHGIKRDCYSG